MEMFSRLFVFAFFLNLFSLSLFSNPAASQVASLATSLTNALKNNPSPYLEQHADDPVNWQTWNKKVIEYARENNRPIYISSGYFSCHWCHVMQRESFQNEAIAQLLNDYFVPVKIDREINPGIDSYLIDFVRETEGIAGWPLNVILTPEGYPVYGTVYQPPEKFEKLLKKVIQTWQTQTDKTRRLAREAAEYQLGFNQPVAATAVNSEIYIDELMSDFEVNADEFQGGFGEQNRFPMAPRLSVLLGLYRDSKNPKLKEWLELTLDQIKNKGLRDHVHGGFFRYTVDPGWTEPHYEKMLYTQAQLASVYIEASTILKRQDYLEVAEDTLAFVSREMQSDGGGYSSSFSAIDRHGNEGAAYLWSQNQLSKTLNIEEQAFVKKYWFNNSPEKQEEKQLPYFSENIKTGKDKRILDSIKRKLGNKNRLENIPVDQTVITAWNALLLSAYANAATATGSKSYIDLAKKLRDKLVNDNWKDGTLYRTSLNKNANNSAHLEDFVFLARGLRDYAVLTSSQEDWYLSNLLLAKAWLLFRHREGWKDVQTSLLPGMQSKTALPDSALPAADAWLVLLSLSSDKPVLQNKAKQAAGLMYETVLKQPLKLSSHYWWVSYFPHVSD